MMNTAVEFLKTPYSIDGAHQYIPAAGQTMTAAAQEKFFRSNYLIHTIRNRVVLDPTDGAVLIQAKYQEIAKANYIMFRNPSYGNKMFYAYILDIKPRAGNEVVEVYYSMDSVQSYLFEWYGAVREGYVSREHLNPSNPKWVDFTLVEDVPTGKLETALVHRSIQNQSRYGEDSGKKHIRWAIFVSSMTTHEISGGLYGPPEAPVEPSKPKPETKPNKPDKPVVQPLPGVSPENSTSTDANYGFSGKEHFVPDKPKLTVGMPRPGDWDYGMPKEMRDAIIAAGGGGDDGKGNSDLDNSKSLAHTLNYYMVPFRSSLSTSKGSITLDGGSVATVREMSDFFANSQDAVGSLIKVLIKNDIPLDKVKVSGNPNIKITTGGSSDNKASIPGGGQYLIFNEANMDLDDNGTVLVQRNNIFDGVHTQKPRLRYPPFTRYYIETEDGAELEFDVTKLPKREAILKYRTNMGPVDNSILHLEGYNSLGGSGRGIDNQYEAHIKFASSKSIPIRTNALASMLQSQENQIQQARTQRQGQALIDRSQIASDFMFDSVNAVMDVASAGMSLENLVNPAAGGIAASKAVSNFAQASTNNAMKLNQVSKQLEWADLEVEARLNDTSNRPDTVGNIGADISYNILNKRNDNIIKIKTVSPGYEAIATDYLNRYGYATMRNKRPNITHRRAYNYVECALNIRGASIPQNHIAKIQTIFGGGVTFWHNANVYDYNQSNAVIGSTYHG